MAGREREGSLEVEAQSTCGKYEVSGARKATVAATSAAPSRLARIQPLVRRRAAMRLLVRMSWPQRLTASSPSSLPACGPHLPHQRLSRSTTSRQTTNNHPPAAASNTLPRPPYDHHHQISSSRSSIGVKSDTTPQTQRHNLKEGRKQANKQLTY
jgi:hypothetical protein